jgi:uncharacterized membrane protein (DUF485 family)
MTTSDSPSPERQFNTRLGLILFAVYLVFYLGFVLINAFAADLMETSTLAGLNLAIVYGFGLIVAALVLALIYGFMCRSEPAENPKDADGDAAKGGPVE